MTNALADATGYEEPKEEQVIQMQIAVSKEQAIAFMHQIARMYGYKVEEP